MKLAALARVAGVVITAAASLCACSNEPNADVPSAPSEGATDAELSGTERAGRTLTSDEIDAALPLVGDFADGWTRDADRNGSVSGAFRPQRCGALLGDLDTTDPVDQQTRSFRSEAVGSYVTIEIRTYADEVPAAALDQAAKALAKCQRFTTTDAVNTRVEVRAEPLQISRSGEASVAARIDADLDPEAIAIDALMVRIGHNLVLGYDASLGGEPNAKRLARIVRTTLQRLRH